MTKIKIMYYPRTVSFETDLELPEFVYPCEIRDSLVKELFKTVPYSVQHAAPDDFVVEEVDRIKNKEYWYLGS